MNWRYQRNQLKKTRKLWEREEDHLEQLGMRIHRVWRSDCSMAPWLSSRKSKGRKRKEWRGSLREEGLTSRRSRNMRMKPSRMSRLSPHALVVGASRPTSLHSIQQGAKPSKLRKTKSSKKLLNKVEEGILQRTLSNTEVRSRTHMRMTTSTSPRLKMRKNKTSTYKKPRATKNKAQTKYLTRLWPPKPNNWKLHAILAC